MRIIITSSSPAHEAIHVDLAGRDPGIERGVILTLTDPSAILAAAKTSDGVDWVVWNATTMPAAERRIAAFAVSLAKRLARGTVYVVLNLSDGRAHRIAGHLRRAGAQPDGGL